MRAEKKTGVKSSRGDLDRSLALDQIHLGRYISTVSRWAFVKTRYLFLWPFLCVHMVGKMGRATSEVNEAKLKMKHPSDMTTPRFEFEW